MFETDQYQLVDVSLLVDVPTEVQLERASARDNNDKTQIQRIIDAQMSRQEKSSRADFVIDNSSDTETLTAVVTDLHQQFLKMAESKH